MSRFPIRFPLAHLISLGDEAVELSCQNRPRQSQTQQCSHESLDCVQLHDQEDLNHQERHGEEPIHVSVAGIVCRRDELSL